VASLYLAKAKKYIMLFIIKKILLILLFASMNSFCNAQDSSKIFFSSSIGMFFPISDFSKSYKNSLALNSGIEYKLNKFYFAQFVLDFNAIKYNQQIRDVNSDYLFQKTNSSVLLAGINLGGNIYLNKKAAIYLSPYLGVGYANIGEPRLKLDITNKIIEQTVIRMQGLFTRQGIRFSIKTKLKALQTLYIDGSYWSSKINVQNSNPKALAVIVGTKMSL
jgi:hypothetical protein